MKKLIKIIIWLLGVIVVLVLGLAILLPQFIDPNDYKQEIAGLVKKQTGRDVTITGDLKLSVFPWLGIETGELALSNPPAFGDEPMLTVKRADIKAKLVPLLRQELQVDTVVLEDPTVHLIIDSQGRTNWDDLAAGAAEPADKDKPGAALAALAVQGVNIKNGRIRWEDRKSGTVYTVSALDLNTGKILAGKPVQAAAKFDFKDRNLPQPVSVDLDAVVVLDLDKGHVAMRDVVVNTAYNDIEASLNSPHLAFDQNTATLTTKRSMVQVAMAGDEASVRWSGLKFAVDKQALSMSEAGVTGAVQGRMVTASLPKLALNLASQNLDIPQLSAAIDDMQLSGVIKGTKVIDQPTFAGHIETKPFDLRPLLKDFALPVQTQDPNVLSQVVLGADFNATLNSINAQKMSLQIDDTHVTGSLEIADFANPVYGFDLDVDRIDVDRYLPSAEAQAGDTTTAPPVAASGAVLVLPLGLFRDLQANGQLRIGKMTLSGLATQDIQLGVRSTPGSVTVEPLRASLYGGTLSGTMQFMDKQEAVRLDVRQSVAAVELGELLKTLEITNDVVGKGNLSMDIVAQERGGAQTVNGTARFQIRDGAIKGVNLRKLVMQAKQIYNQVKGREAEVEMDDKDEFQFTELTGTIKFNEKIATNDDLRVKSPLLRVTGSGQADLVASTLDYLIRINVVETSKGQAGEELEDLKGVTIPVRVQGKLEDPTYRLDVETLLKDAAKREIEKQLGEKKEKLEKKLEDKLQKGLERLFK
jgi:AsmA protein